MTTPAAEYRDMLRDACRADRAPGATLAQRGAASERAEAILEAAGAVGIDLYSEFLDIDEAVRVELYGADAWLR